MSISTRAVQRHNTTIVSPGDRKLLLARLHTGPARLSMRMESTASNNTAAAAAAAKARKIDFSGALQDCNHGKFKELLLKLSLSTLEFVKMREVGRFLEVDAGRLQHAITQRLPNPSENLLESPVHGTCVATFALKAALIKYCISGLLLESNAYFLFDYLLKAEQNYIKLLAPKRNIVRQELTMFISRNQIEADATEYFLGPEVSPAKSIMPAPKPRLETATSASSSSSSTERPHKRPKIWSLNDTERRTSTLHTEPSSTKAPKQTSEKASQNRPATNEWTAAPKGPNTAKTNSKDADRNESTSAVSSDKQTKEGLPSSPELTLKERQKIQWAATFNALNTNDDFNIDEEGQKILVVNANGSSTKNVERESILANCKKDHKIVVLDFGNGYKAKSNDESSFLFFECGGLKGPIMTESLPLERAKTCILLDFSRDSVKEANSFCLRMPRKR